MSEGTFLAWVMMYPSMVVSSKTTPITGMDIFMGASSTSSQSLLLQHKYLFEVRRRSCYNGIRVFAIIQDGILRVSADILHVHMRKSRKKSGIVWQDKASRAEMGGVRGSDRLGMSQNLNKASTEAVEETFRE